MLSIGAFAKLVGVSVRMLRHYDQLGLLPPARVDQHTGYRYYAAEQLDRANRLVAFKELGFPLEQVAALLKNGDADDQVRDLLEQRQRELARQIEVDQRRLQRITARLRTIERSTTMPTNAQTAQLAEVNLPAVDLVQLSARVADMESIEQEIGPMFERVNARIADAGLTARGPGIAHYTTDGEVVIAAAAEQVEGGSIPEGLERARLEPVARALQLTYESENLDGIQSAWQELVKGVESRGLVAIGTCREVYRVTPYDGDKWVVDLQQPVA